MTPSVCDSRSQVPGSSDSGSATKPLALITSMPVPGAWQIESNAPTPARPRARPRHAMRAGKRDRPSRLALQGASIPVAADGRGLIGALQELQQGCVRVRRGAHGVVRQDELAELRVVPGGCRPHLAGAVALRLGIGVGVEGGIVDGPAAWPEAGAADLVRVGLRVTSSGQVGCAAGMARRRAAGKARHGQVEAAPEEVHRALPCQGSRVRNRLNTRSTWTMARQQRWTASRS